MSQNLKQILVSNVDKFYPELAPIVNANITGVSLENHRVLHGTSRINVFEVTFSDKTGMHHSRSIFAKFKMNISKNEFRRMNKIWNSNNYPNQRCYIPRPLFITRDYFFMEYVGDKSLLNYFAPRLTHFTWKIFYSSLTKKIIQLAEWLADYHKIQTRYFSEPLQPYIEKATHQVSDNSRFSNTEKSNLIKYIERTAMNFPEIPKLECHGDFYFRNMQVFSGKIYVIDWESRPFRGNFLLDFNSLVLNMLSFSRYPIFSRKAAKLLVKIFVETYLRNSPLTIEDDLLDLTNILFLIQYLDDYDRNVNKWTPRKSFFNDLYMNYIQKKLLRLKPVY